MDQSSDGEGSNRPTAADADRSGPAGTFAHGAGAVVGIDAGDPAADEKRKESGRGDLPAGDSLDGLAGGDPDGVAASRSGVGWLAVDCDGGAGRFGNAFGDAGSRLVGQRLDRSVTQQPGGGGDRRQPEDADGGPEAGDRLWGQHPADGGLSCRAAASGRGLGRVAAAR